MHRKTVRNSMLLFAFVFSISACSGWKYVKEGTTEEVAKEDRDACYRSASRKATAEYPEHILHAGYGSTQTSWDENLTKRASAIVDYEHDCMVAKGYHLE